MTWHPISERDPDFGWWFGHRQGSWPTGVVIYRRWQWGDTRGPDEPNPRIWVVELPGIFVSGDFPVDYVRSELEELLASTQRAIAALDHLPEGLE